ncbi:MAG: general secretion pathway protein GspB [Pseudomonadaceae bacterium]|nr:general secretion pathway protein GspB [Pseudomonadaceae bacterium]
MSYILDALKKSQAEQSAEGVSLATHTTASRKPRPRGLLTLVILLVATNVGLLLWVTLQRSQSHPVATDAPAAVSKAPAEAQLDTPAPTAAPVVTAVPVVTEPAVVARPKPTPRSVSPVKKLQLSELPTSEQSKFNNFNYSSHIYTDDPELCAVVINGQRLSAGDVFEGMEVIAITEEGVVFGSSRISSQGQVEPLHVAVSVIEQWEK